MKDITLEKSAGTISRGLNIVCNIDEIAMPRKTLKSATLVYNVLGILSLRSYKKSFKVSKLLAWFNVTKICLVYFLTFALLTNQQLRRIIFNFNMSDSKIYSLFVQFTSFASNQIPKIVALLLCLVQFKKRQEISDFFNQMNVVKFGEDLSKKLRSLFWTYLMWRLLIFTAITTAQFAAKFKFSTIACVYAFTLLYPHIILGSTESILIFFENFLVIYLQDLRYTLESNLSKTVFDTEMFEKLAINCEKIFALNESFHKSFGNQLTIMTCSATILTTLQVIQDYFDNFVDFYKFFKFSAISSITNFSKV